MSSPLDPVKVWFNNLMARPFSVATDAAISIGFAVVAYMLLSFVRILPLGDAIQAGGAGVIGAMVYMRARTNLTDPAPAGFKG